MRMYDLITKKRDGGELSHEEIYWFIDGYTRGDIPDYQASALMMAIYFRGMTDMETLDLTGAMTYSGDVMDLSDLDGIKADKHSTGGVGDKTSLVLTPLVASCNVTMAKMSGRGLGHTGGTIDKLESIPGFDTGISMEKFKECLRTNGLAIMGQTLSLAPADKKLYALRDVTGTVENMSLIASSIMSKKLAAGADIIVLDVKTGGGAFMKSYSDSLALAEKMIWLGKRSGRKVAAVISEMDEPLGYAIGNSLEVKEAVNTLRGQGSGELLELCLTLGSLILREAGICPDTDSGKARLKENIDNGLAYQKFLDFVASQGGDVSAIEDMSRLPAASITEPVRALKDGYVHSIDCLEAGLCSMILGGGRATKESVIDPAVGIVLEKKKGDMVKAGDVLACIHANDSQRCSEAAERLLAAYDIKPGFAQKSILIKEIL